MLPSAFMSRSVTVRESWWASVRMLSRSPCASSTCPSKWLLSNVVLFDMTTWSSQRHRQADRHLLVPSGSIRELNGQDGGRQGFHRCRDVLLDGSVVDHTAILLEPVQEPRVLSVLIGQIPSASQVHVGRHGIPSRQRWQWTAIRQRLQRQQSN